MTMNPETGQGYDAVQVGEEEYFDPNAQDPENYPGSVGLIIRKKTYWQGDVEFDTFDTVGPKFGPKWPEGTMRVSGLGTDSDVWGLSDKEPPVGPYTPWLKNGTQGGGTNSGTNIFTSVRKPSSGIEIIPKHEWTPCYEDDGELTLGEFEQRNYIDITLLGAYGGDIKFPVMPEEFGADFTHEYWTPRVIGLGEIIMPGGQSMETISWDSFFPSHYDADYCSISPLDLEDPRSVTARLIWTMRFKMNCMLIVGGGIWNDQVVITNFNYRHKAGEVFDIYYTISLKRYRAPVVSTNPNPDALWDRRSAKDPRAPARPSTELAPLGQIPTDLNEGAVDVVPDEAPGTLIGPPAPGTRGSLTSLETDGKVLGQPAKDIRQPGGPTPAWSETFQQVVARFSKVGPNTMEKMLELNPWVIDNNYNPYTTQLPVGAGVNYLKDNPVSAAKPTIITDAGAGEFLRSIDEALAEPKRAFQTYDPSELLRRGRLIGPPAPGVPANTPQNIPEQGGIRR